jgi:hypothetical protein
MPNKFTETYAQSEWAGIERRSHERLRLSPSPRVVIKPAAPSEQDWTKGFCGGILVASIVWGTILGALLCRI